MGWNCRFITQRDTSPHDTELREPRRKGTLRGQVKDVKGIVEVPWKMVRDAAIASVLDREKTRSPSTVTWTWRTVSDFHKRHGIASLREKAKEKEGG